LRLAFSNTSLVFGRPYETSLSKALFEGFCGPLCGTFESPSKALKRRLKGQALYGFYKGFSKAF
jgi:hypothetical protein